MTTHQIDTPAARLVAQAATAGVSHHDPAPPHAAGTCAAGAGSPHGSAPNRATAGPVGAEPAECIHGLEPDWCSLCGPTAPPKTRTLRSTGPIIQARHRGHCDACEQPIQPGDPIARCLDDIWRHTHCISLQPTHRRYPISAHKCGHRPSRRIPIEGTDRAVCDDCGSYMNASRPPLPAEPANAGMGGRDAAAVEE